MKPLPALIDENGTPEMRYNKRHPRRREWLKKNGWVKLVNPNDKLYISKYRLTGSNLRLIIHTGILVNEVAKYKCVVMTSKKEIITEYSDWSEFIEVFRHDPPRV
jgi:hypothetical protein